MTREREREGKQRTAQIDTTHQAVRIQNRLLLTHSFHSSFVLSARALLICSMGHVFSRIQSKMNKKKKKKQSKRNNLYGMFQLVEMNLKKISISKWEQVVDCTHDFICYETLTHIFVFALHTNHSVTHTRTHYFCFFQRRWKLNTLFCLQQCVVWIRIIIFCSTYVALVIFIVSNNSYNSDRHNSHTHTPHTKSELTLKLLISTSWTHIMNCDKYCADIKQVRQVYCG